jgi:hypothetical protein
MTLKFFEPLARVDLDCVVCCAEISNLRKILALSVFTCLACPTPNQIEGKPNSKREDHPFLGSGITSVVQNSRYHNELRAFTTAGENCEEM